MPVKTCVTNLQIKMSTDCRLQFHLRLAIYILYVVWVVVLNVLSPRTCYCFEFLGFNNLCLKLPEMYLYPGEYDCLILIIEYSRQHDHVCICI